MRRTVIAGTVIGLVAALGIAAPSQATPAAAPAKATIGLFHGIPKVPVDVYIGKDKVVDDFQPGTFAGPLMVKAGTYTVRITAADAKNAKRPIIGPEKVKVAAGGNYSVIAHLTTKGAPTLTTYKNDLSSTPATFGRVVVRHVAAAPAVDVVVNGDKVFRNIKNPNQVKMAVPAVTYEVAVTLAGKKKAVLGPVHLEVAENTNTIVYAWGSAKDGTLALTTRTVPLQPRS